MSGKEHLSQIPLPPWGIFTGLLLDDVTFKQSYENGILCLKLRLIKSRRAAERLRSVTQFMMQAPRGRRTKDYLRTSPGQGKASSSGNLEQCWESSDRGEVADPFLPLFFCPTSASSHMRPLRKGWNSSPSGDTTPYHTSSGLGPWVSFAPKFPVCQSNARGHK